VNAAGAFTSCQASIKSLWFAILVDTYNLRNEGCEYGEKGVRMDASRPSLMEETTCGHCKFWVGRCTKNRANRIASSSRCEEFEERGG